MEFLYTGPAYDFEHAFGRMMRHSHNLPVLKSGGNTMYARGFRHTHDTPFADAPHIHPTSPEEFPAP